MWYVSVSVCRYSGILFCHREQLQHLHSEFMWYVSVSVCRYSCILFCHREQLQHLHGEFMATRRELAQAHRERDRLARELEDMVAASQVSQYNLMCHSGQVS